MPIYEYRCVDCQKTFSLRRPMREADAPVECEHCHSRQIKRQLSRIAPVRGSGGGGGSGGCAGCSSGNCNSCGH